MSPQNNNEREGKIFLWSVNYRSKILVPPKNLVTIDETSRRAWKRMNSIEKRRIQCARLRGSEEKRLTRNP